MSECRDNKVALLVCHDLVGLLMLNGIVPAMKKSGLEPVIFNAPTRRNRTLKVSSPSIVAAFNVHALEGVILPFMERTRDMDAPNLTYRQLVEKHGLQYHEIEDVNDPAFVEKIKASKDIVGGVSFRFRQIFGPSVIEAFRDKGFLWNLHSGLLPDYKGILLPYRAIQNGEKEYGVTLHEVAPRIDQGGIIEKGVLPLDRARPVLDLYLDTVETAVGIMAGALERVARADMPQATPQLGQTGQYYTNPTTEEFGQFTAQGIFYADGERTVLRVAEAFAGAGTLRSSILTAALDSFLVGEPRPMGYAVNSGQRVGWKL